MISVTRRFFFKTLALLGMGATIPIIKAKEKSILPVVRFKKKGNYVIIVNGSEIMKDIQFERVSANLHPSFNNIVFVWKRRCKVWINKEDAICNNCGNIWGEVFLIERPGFCYTRNTAHVEFQFEACEKTQYITFPMQMTFSDNKNEMCHEIEQAFADTVGARPNLVIDDFIGVDE